jgi:hypothetical protein
MNDIFLKRLDQTFTVESVEKALMDLSKDNDFGKAKQEIYKDISYEELMNAHKMFQVFLDKASKSTGAKKEFYIKLAKILQGFYNKYIDKVGQQASYDASTNTKTAKGFRGFVQKTSNLVPQRP